jgi:hypothetical protein
MTFIRLIFILFYFIAPKTLTPPNPLLQGEPNVFREAKLLLPQKA